MPHDLPKAYDPTAIEDHWAEYWVKENLFAQPTPDASSASSENASAGAASSRPGGQPFVILLPPPNVTGNLHMGHMFEHTESDILMRWHRMRGDRVLWIPGTDHAGIATQMLVERQVVSEGSTRQKMGREAFVERVWEWRRHYGGAILGQMKRLGASVDWQREYFTMDERLSVAVREAFVKLYEQGLIYRGAYIVNWCPRCQTAISDLEVVYDEHKGHLWEIRYPVIGADGKDSGEFLTVATTRPETMLGDVAVAIHPEDERYTHLHGRKLRLPLMDREIPIILDDWVSREFGTGAVKVTPAHDPNDFALGQRHNLPSINLMDDTAHINNAGGKYAGLDRFVARKEVVADLEAQGLLAGIKDHVHNVGHCDRCKTIVEPRLSLQWFVAVNKKVESRGASIAELAIAAVTDGHIRFTPDNYQKIYLQWMENIHDWCISRQLWWGHRIPAWECGVCHKVTVTREDPSKCTHCGSEKISQSTDVLDTWFSSGLLPVSVFGWPKITPENRADFDTFYPTSLLVTGFDILFFWVARMIMMGCWFAGDVPNVDGSKRELKDAVPFREVYIHALVRDANREKMSKTKGNVVDPIEIVKQYGTDAVRFTLASMASPGTDIAFNVARTEGYRAFANKIWNAARFIFMNVDRAREAGIHVEVGAISRPKAFLNEWPTEELWILSRLNRVVHDVNLALEKYRFDDAANLVYQFFWGEFCDWYLEFAKLRLDFDAPENRESTGASLSTMLYVFEASLRMLSPFMPFITEELWHALHESKLPRKSVALTNFPAYEQHDQFTQMTFESAEIAMQVLQNAVTGIRSRRKELKVAEKVLVKAKIAGTLNSPMILRKHQHIIERLGRVGELEIVYFSDRNEGGKYDKLAWQSAGPIDVYVEHERPIDVAAEREKLQKDFAKQQQIVANSEAKLNNPGFTSKAPAHIVEGLKKQLDEARKLLDKLRRDLEGLNG